MWIKNFNINEALEYPRLMQETFDLEAVEDTLEGEFHREMHELHPLKMHKITVIAQHSEDPNVFAFKTDHPDYKLISVHLTWAKESTIDFPIITNLSEQI